MCKNKIYRTNKNSFASLVALIILLLMILVGFSGCSSVESENCNAITTVVRSNEPRFIVEEFYGNFVDAAIITDTRTGVQYLFYQNGNAGGLTKLETE